jgi:hypothetical protein
VKKTATVGDERGEMESEKQLVRVIDVPLGVDAAEVERLLNAPSANEYYLASIVPGELTGTRGVAHRVFYKRRAARKEENG